MMTRVATDAAKLPVPQDVKLKDKQVFMLLIPLKQQQLLMLLKVWLRKSPNGFSQSSLMHKLEC